jgi:hypothetical protein
LFSGTSLSQWRLVDRRVLLRRVLTRLSDLFRLTVGRLAEMPLQCPACESSALRVEAAIELGSDDRSDEVALQVVACAACGFEAVAVYAESRRGALGDESVSHFAFPADPAAVAKVRRIIASCPRARDAACACAAHRRAREMAGEPAALTGAECPRPLPIVFIRS